MLCDETMQLPKNRVLSRSLALINAMLSYYG